MCGSYICQPPCVRETVVRSELRIHPIQLYNVAVDPGETDNVFDQHQKIVEHLTEPAEMTWFELGDQDRKGNGQRPAGCVTNPTLRMLP